MAKILSIKEATVGDLEGFEVVTETDTHFIGISNAQNCCEDWGYLITEDEPEEFVGCELLHVCYTGERYGELFTQAIEEMPSSEETVAYFVTFVTNRGNFQVVAYNEHNGYYGHHVEYLKNGKMLHRDRI